MTDHLSCKCENNRTITVLEKIEENFFITESIWVKISQIPFSSIGFTKLKRFKVDLKVEKQTLSYIVYGSINCLKCSYSLTQQSYF